MAAGGAEVRADTRQFQRLGKALREAGDGQIKKKLYKGVQRATKPAKAEIKKSAISVLPRRGGLNQWAAQLTVRTRQFYQGNGAGVIISGSKNAKKTSHSYVVPSTGKRKRRRTRRKNTFGAAADMRALNRGRVMHPVFGHGPLVGPQRVKAGFFDVPLDGPIGDQMKKEILAVLDEIMQEIDQKVRQG